MALFTIDHVGLLLRKLKEVQYEAKHVGISLGLKNEDIEAVCKSPHKTPHECLQCVFVEWLKLDSIQRTWKILVQALRCGGDHVVANSIANSYTLDQSVSVSLDDLLGLVNGINTTRWRSLGLNLGLPLYQINEIDDRGSWSEYIMIELLRLWVTGNGKPATLVTLVTAVKKLPNIDLAERLAADRELHLSSCSESDMDSVIESPIISATKHDSSKHNVISNPTSLLQKYNLSQPDVEIPCDDNLFLILEPKISNFDDTAQYFGFDQPEVDIQIAEQSRELSMLWEWRDINGSDATYLAIIKIFLQMKEQNLAEIVLQHFKEYQPKPIKSFVYPEKVTKYGNWDEKSMAEQEQIKNRLFNENKDIRKKFASLTRRIFCSFKDNNVDVTELKIFLYSYGFSDNTPILPHTTLLPEFESATDLDGIFLVLSKYYSSWLNIQLLKAIVEEFGNEEDQKEMKAYEEELAHYLQRSIYEIPSKFFAPGHKNTDLIFLFVLLPNNVPSGEDIEDITRNMSQLLGISDGILQFIGFKNCSILLKFGVPKQLIHINTIRNFVETHFNIVKKGYTFSGDLSLLWHRKYDNYTSRIKTTESIIPHDVPLTSSSNISELSNVDLILKMAMKEGGGKMKPCNTILHGPPGVGKSSLKRVILGQPPLPKEKQNATHIVETAARVVSTDRLTSKGRKLLAEVDNTDMKNMLAKKAESLRQTSQSPQDDPSDDSTHQHIPEPQHNILYAFKNFFKNFLTPQPIPSPPQPIPSPPQPIPPLTSSEAIKSIREQMGKHVKPSSEIFDVDWMYLIDSGGQPQFLDVLPLLYRNESLHIVVTRLDEELDDRPEFRYIVKGTNVASPGNLRLSNREFIERACQIAEAQAMSGKFVPKVMVIGTHKDKLGIDGEARLKEINKELMKLHQKYNRVLIRKSKDEVIFAMNAMAPVGEERQQYTEELQACILKAAEETGYEINVPLKWLAFHLDLDKMEGVVHISECYKTGEILGMGKSDVKEALKYFNKVGLLLYFPDDVPDLIFTKMDALIDRLSRLITASFITPDSCVTAPYDRLREKGLFNKSFLPTIFEDLYESKEKFSDDDFLKLLECLKISVHVGDNDYFLPSALSLEPSVDDSPFPMSCVPLVYSWDEQILPHGFFLTLVVELLRQKESNDDLHFELRKDVIQCRHEIQLIVAKRRIPGVVKLGDRKRWVEVCYSGDMRYCRQLQEVTSAAIENVLRVFKHTGLRSPTIGFLCKLCDTNDHYGILSFDQRVVSCSRNESKDGEVKPDMLCWIKRHGSSQYSVSHLTTDYSPFNIFKRHMSEMLGVISDTERLANDLSSVDLISYQVKDDVVTTNLSRYQKASKLLNEIERSLRVQVLDNRRILISYCEVLKKQKNRALRKIADDMIKELG